MTDKKKSDKPETWCCPLCYREVKFGTFGCDNPDECPEPKNYVFMMTRKYPNGRFKPGSRRGVGISQISDEE